MSMLTTQADELRKAAAAMEELGREIGKPYGMSRGLIRTAQMMREAADTIEGLRDRLQPVPAELDYVEDKSRWFQLFGTPERAARTIAAMMDKCSDRPHGCDGCMLFDVCDDEANALEWLRSDAE